MKNFINKKVVYCLTILHSVLLFFFSLSIYFHYDIDIIYCLYFLLLPFSILNILTFILYIKETKLHTYYIFHLIFNIIFTIFILYLFPIINHIHKITFKQFYDKMSYLPLMILSLSFIYLFISIIIFILKKEEF